MQHLNVVPPLLFWGLLRTAGGTAHRDRPGKPAGGDWPAERSTHRSVGKTTTTTTTTQPFGYKRSIGKIAQKV